MGLLNEIGIKYGTDKSSQHHNYLDYYESKISVNKDKKINLLEIGILFGQSTKMFKEYFSVGNIFSFDINNKKHLEEERISILTGDQSDRTFLDFFEDDFFDIIIDDGSHKMDHQQISLGILFKKLKRGGVYILEDLHTSDLNYIETKNHGLSLFNITADGNNSTINFLNGLKENGPFINYYLTKEEYDYLKDNIASLEIKETSKTSEQIKSITSCIIKR